MSAGGSFTGVLDGVSNVAAAYSLRRLSSAYSGSAVRVRRSSDSTEQDIGFDGSGEFDIVAFSAFVGGGTGYVKTWYDQSGNGRDATQTTTANQPKISLAAINGAPTIYFFNKSLSVPNFVATTPMSLMSVWKIVTDGMMMEVSANLNSASGFWLYGLSPAVFVKFATNQILTNNSSGWIGTSETIASFTYNGSILRLYKSGSGVTSASHTITPTSVTDTLWIGARGGSALSIAGDCAEIVIFSTAISTADHNTIGNDMATRFGLSWTTVT